MTSIQCAYRRAINDLILLFPGSYIQAFTSNKQHCLIISRISMKAILKMQPDYLSYNLHVKYILQKK